MGSNVRETLTMLSFSLAISLLTSALILYEPVMAKRVFYRNVLVRGQNKGLRPLLLNKYYLFVPETVLETLYSFVSSRIRDSRT